MKYGQLSLPLSHSVIPIMLENSAKKLLNLLETVKEKDKKKNIIIPKSSVAMKTEETQTYTKTLKNKKHTICRSLAKPLSRLRAGDPIEVIYPKNDPKRAIVNTWDELWLVPLFFGLFLIAAIFLLVHVCKGYGVS